MVNHRGVLNVYKSVDFMPSIFLRYIDFTLHINTGDIDATSNPSSPQEFVRYLNVFRPEIFASILPKTVVCATRVI